MMLSTDGGLTYTDIFNADNPKPDSFYHTEETPTIYKLDFTDGTQKLITVSGRPSWADQPGDKGEGWDAAISASLDENGKCDGLEWSEHENFYGPNAVREEYTSTRTSTGPMPSAKNISARRAQRNTTRSSP